MLAQLHLFGSASSQAAKVLGTREVTDGLVEGCPSPFVGPPWLVWVMGAFLTNRFALPLVAGCKRPGLRRFLCFFGRAVFSPEGSSDTEGESRSEESWRARWAGTFGGHRQLLGEEGMFGD